LLEIISVSISACLFDSLDWDSD